MPVPQENLFFVEQASCLLLTQDACSTRKSILCGTGILPVADNGATSQFNQFNNYNLLIFSSSLPPCPSRLRGSLKKALFANYIKKL
ncbi:MULTISPECIES: hypothetical protein [unclassified Microcoleus]|uniref:hypothetical protein n=1 Tax=unclassified Microcoleus TaxID=2642155 RepID=UPI002FD2DC31